MTLIYKVCPRRLWEEARRAGVFAGAPIDVQDGFIHFSTAEQVSETVARHFTGQSDLLVLGVDPEGLGEDLRYEASRGGALFPHLYGPLPLRAVRVVKPLRLEADGRVVLPAPEL